MGKDPTIHYVTLYQVLIRDSCRRLLDFSNRLNIRRNPGVDPGVWNRTVGEVKGNWMDVGYSDELDEKIRLSARSPG